MKACKVDGRNRITLPTACPPRSRVTIEQVDAGTWIVRLQPSGIRLKRILLPVIEHLPKDSDWEKTELKAARAVARRLKPEEE